MSAPRSGSPPGTAATATICPFVWPDVRLVVSTTPCLSLCLYSWKSPFSHFVLSLLDEPIRALLRECGNPLAGSGQIQRCPRRVEPTTAVGKTISPTQRLAPARSASAAIAPCAQTHSAKD